MMAEIDGKVLYQGSKGSVIRPPLLWSPDGRQLAFIEQHGDRRNLLIVPVTPVRPKALTDRRTLPGVR